MNPSSSPRKSHIDIGKIYFWTATIHNWQHLLKTDSFKEIVMDSLRHLSQKVLIDVFAFVIMPNHIHLIWRINGVNGKEMPHASFLKFTAHEFKAHLDPNELMKYKVDLANKNYEFWKRDSLAIELYSPKVAYQKLDYLHLNPLQEHWQLAKHPADYYYSSAAFYEKEGENFGFLKHLGEEF